MHVSGTTTVCLVCLTSAVTASQAPDVTVEVHDKLLDHIRHAIAVVHISGCPVWLHAVICRWNARCRSLHRNFLSLLLMHLLLPNRPASIYRYSPALIVAVQIDSQ